MHMINPMFRYMGKKTASGEAAGEGVLIYENKDSFQGIFNDGILNRWERENKRGFHGPDWPLYNNIYGGQGTL